MNKLIRVLLSALLITGIFTVIAPPAHAHGSCNSVSYKPDRVPGGIRFKGQIGCTNTHDPIWVIVESGRRPGGSTDPFNWYDLDQKVRHGDDFVVHTLDTAWDCNKDYRTRVSTFATDGGVNHGVDNMVSNIFSSTC